MSKLYLLILISFCALTMINAQIAYKITPDKIIIKDKNNFDDDVTESFINNTEDSVIIYVKRYVKNFEDNLKDKRTRGFTQIVIDPNGYALAYDVYRRFTFPKNDTDIVFYNIINRSAPDEIKLADETNSMVPEGLDLPENPNFISVDKSGSSSLVIHDPSNKKARVHIERLIIPPHDSSQYRYSLDLKFYDLKKGKYKVISYYYMNDLIQEEIGKDLYSKEKDKIFTGELKANGIEVIVE